MFTDNHNQKREIPLSSLEKKKPNFGIKSPEEWRNKEGRKASDQLFSLYEGYFFSILPSKEGWEKIEKTYRAIEKYSSKKSAEFFDVNSVDRWETLAEGYESICEDFLLNNIFESLIDHGSCGGHLARLFVRRAVSNIDVARAFFKNKQTVWEYDNPNRRMLILQQFLTDVITMSDLLIWTLSESETRYTEDDVVRLHHLDQSIEPSQISLPADTLFIPNWKVLLKKSFPNTSLNEPSTRAQTIAVRLEVPMPDHDPWWYEMESNPTLEDDEDDTDYYLSKEFKSVFDKPLKIVDLQHLYFALKENDDEKISNTLEALISRGSIPQKKKEFIIDGLRTIAQMYGWGKQESPSSFEKDLNQIAEKIPLPVSAEVFEAHHRNFNKRRTIESFSQILHKRILEVAVTFLVDATKKDRYDKGSIIQSILLVEEKARSLYAEVVEKGLPAFKEYISWINQESKRSAEAGKPYPGEFYVGRDTFTTLYPAAKVFRWGKMTSPERRALTVFVNVSRPLVNNMRRTHQMRMMMKDWLEKEGVTRSMFGIDGGYSGSSPFEVFAALDPDFSGKQGDEQIRLLSTSNKARRTVAESYGEVVSWMEALPKFTDRAQRVLKTEFGKYYVESAHRSSVERLLAWTVQHAVWREIIHYDPNEKDLRSEQDMLAVFDCEKHQVAHSIDEINESTKAYVGKLEPGIFDRLSEGVEHVYTKFPEGHIRRQSIEIGGKDERELEELLERSGHHIYMETKLMMAHDDFKRSLREEDPRQPDWKKWKLKSPEEAKLIRLSVEDLGFPSGATTDQIFAKAQELGLELCPPEVGPQFSLQYTDQSMDEYTFVGMKQIHADGDQRVFGMLRNDNGMRLDSYLAKPMLRWDERHQFVFRLPKKS
ncbi:MAG: hypothetical protein UT30_C0010G0020 [Candidatus Uhrbacteria bacterium GW2011_GWF2_39_13]|uniref:Uncharacterized protein n=1 Tax=Candidatus Uhrbacteria bacterium GW2011_GWF2_39_13 TaxID=1618995 RepID=A0A0G0MV02_9BACT|nr:MAG: hypothetical protein UT30_C0010G0020 [Candidatus Uhrbacteria bacterium GW2011_GWF2_39_13]HAU65800.1 hypothetical protein [Candidatus Uhrbacteria bacterium]